VPGPGFWTRDAALETVLEEILDAWTIQAVAGFTGCMSPGLDEHLAGRPHLVAAVTAALERIRDRVIHLASQERGPPPATTDRGVTPERSSVHTDY
jgi:hypothetical protein